MEDFDEDDFERDSRYEDTPSDRERYQIFQQLHTIHSPTEVIKLNSKLKINFTDELYSKLSENLGMQPNAKHYDLIEIEDGELFFVVHNHKMRIELTKNGKFRSMKTLIKDLGKNRLRALGFDIETNFKLPTSDQINKSTPKEFLEMAEIVEKVITEEINETSFTDTVEAGNQTERELRGLDKAMQTISGSLKKSVAEKKKN